MRMGSMTPATTGSFKPDHIQRPVLASEIIAPQLQASAKSIGEQLVAAQAEVSHLQLCLNLALEKLIAFSKGRRTAEEFLTEIEANINELEDKKNNPS